MNKNIEEKVDDIISYVKESSEYKKCMEIKQQMYKNENLNKLIEDIKKLQKIYIRENDDLIKQELRKKEIKLNNIPIYQEYNNYLSKVNEKINLIKESLNDYFEKKLNEDII